MADNSFALGPGMPCSIDRLVDTRLLIQANSGGGKSWCLRRVLEQTHGAVQHLVIDPEGEFASLRERFDYVLAARSDGDTAADPRTAKLLAERLLELGVSAILDIYELKAHQRIQFVRFFLEALVDAPKKLWHPVLVAVDEAHVYAPQQGEAESAGPVIDLCTRGRKRGFCAVLATQRLSKLHKDAAAELNNKLIGRTGLDVDVKRAADELGFGKERWRELRELPEGHFFTFGPAISREVRPVTIGPVLTTHPKAGARLAFTAPPPTAKVKALLPKLADLPAEAAGRERTLAELQRELTETKRALTIAQKASPAAPAAKERRVEVKVRVLSEPLVRRLEVAVKRLATHEARSEEAIRRAIESRKRVEESVRALERRLDEALTPEDKLLAALRPHLESMSDAEIETAITKTDRILAGLRDGPPSMPQHAPASARMPQHVASPPRPTSAHRPTTSTLPKGERVVLTAIAQHQDGVTREQLTVLTGYKRSSRDTYLQRLRERELVNVAGETIVATDAGVDALGTDFEPLPTGDALREHWLAKLPEGERRVLQVLVEAYPKAVERERISDVTEYKRSSRDTYLQRLSARKLVTSDRGMVRASDELFG